MRGYRGRWFYNYLCNQCLSPLMLWVRIPLRRGILDKTVCDKVCQWLAVGGWFSSGNPVSYTSKTDLHYIAEILLKVALNIKALTLYVMISSVQLSLLNVLDISGTLWDKWVAADMFNLYKDSRWRNLHNIVLWNNMIIFL
jgi:hypothetical protein